VYDRLPNQFLRLPQEKEGRTKHKHGDFGVNGPDGVENGSELRVRAPNWHVPRYHATPSA